MSRGQALLISSIILLVVGFILIISSGSAMISIGQSISLEEMLKTITGGILGNILDKSEPVQLLTNEDKIILGMSTFGVLAGIVLIVNGIILIIGSTILLLYDRKQHKRL
ncbi:MAG: hypothetical protein R3321_09375 [Nitrososphaeraceae archaeon]|nr:hypothetical protein [Nitrososphaeraceae archaeon]